jgi:hypothetical protein
VEGWRRDADLEELARAYAGKEPAYVLFNNLFKGSSWERTRCASCNG